MSQSKLDGICTRDHEKPFGGGVNTKIPISYYQDRHFQIHVPGMSLIHSVDNAQSHFSLYRSKFTNPYARTRTNKQVP